MSDAQVQIVLASEASTSQEVRGERGANGGERGPTRNTFSGRQEAGPAGQGARPPARCSLGLGLGLGLGG